MTSFPKLAFMCPIPWDKMEGDEKARFCSRCSKTVVNVSALTEPERRDLFARSDPRSLCVAYYRRLSGEFVSAEAPLPASESSRVRQFGVAALSAGALAIAVGCSANKSAVSSAETVTEKSVADRPVEKDNAVMVVGMVACPFDAESEPPASNESEDLRQRETPAASDDSVREGSS